MARPVRVMRWDDPGAPQRSPANAASIVNILKKCLVEGYGTTDPLGWTLEYEDAPGGIAVFRNSPVSGSGGYFRISPYNIPTNAYILTQSAMAATGSAPADLFNPGYLNSIPADENLTRWLLIGDDKSFYLILHHTSNNYNASTAEICIFIGDFKPSVSSDVATFICTGSNAGSTSTIHTVGFFTVNTGPLSDSAGRTTVLNGVLGGANPANALGVPASVAGAGGLLSHALYIAGELSQANIADATNVDWPAGGLVQPVAIKRNAALSNTEQINVDNPYIRGYLPGAISLGWKSHRNATWPVTKNIDAISYFGVALNSNAAVNGGVMVWINLEDWG